ncbi:acetyl-CoA C-acetyltransferase [Rhodococcoides kyotonense]|uniref:Probable acetyl-CoA acetyltransferase n=1 Tax=Rhodococcoides kyotonense TaxID=398843 RepID=A0A239MRB7_9NOCA|nr:acetyl-CoA C-acetyltransferase [Rhodococcus kyotonensis]SNT45020.1 acetyl-CoA C-acetyltransferase [Rhodococcus kyotonensis]
MRRAAIVAPTRTAIGAFGGGLKNVAVEDLGAAVATAVVERSGIDPAVIEDMVFAQSYSNSETPCVGRWIALQAGFPIDVAGMQLDRRCGGGLQSIATAAMMIQSGAADVVMAGGVESMSNVEFYTTDMRWGSKQGSVKLHDRLDRGRERAQPVERFGYISGMIETAENLARKYSITRDEADAFAVQSQVRAAAAWDEGRFSDEVVPVKVPQRRGDTVVFDRDEGIRADSSVQKLAKLRSIMPDGTVTAGNACQQNDAAAACLVVAEDRLDRLGLTPIGFLHGWAAVGCEPSEMGIGPVPAVRKLLTKLGLSLADIDLIEINEAFAVQVLAVLQELNIEDQSIVNVNGSGISLGHPVGATGSRIMTTLLHEMKRRGARYGVETMCIGGGQGIAAVFESA